MARRTFPQLSTLWTALIILLSFAPISFAQLELPDEVTLTVGKLKVRGWKGNPEAVRELAKQGGEGLPADGFVYQERSDADNHLSFAVWSSHGLSKEILSAAESHLTGLIADGNPGHQPAGFFYAGMSGEEPKRVQAPRLRKVEPKGVEPKVVQTVALNQPLDLKPLLAGTPSVELAAVQEGPSMFWLVLLAVLSVGMGVLLTISNRFQRVRDRKF